MRRIYRTGFNYAKAGVILLDLQSADIEQYELPLDASPNDKGSLMSAMDKINDRYGRGSVTVGSVGNRGERRRWVMKSERRTPAYTTKWTELMTVRLIS